jgi:hypothetical protein
MSLLGRDYFWQRLTPQERREAHQKYVLTFPLQDLKYGFEGYHEVLQLVERRPVIRTIGKRFDTYIGYHAFENWPGMEFRAWVDHYEARFKQGADRNRDLADLAALILSRQEVDMHLLKEARFSQNSLPDLDKVAKTLIKNALWI